jgi:hypothetical protein
MSKNGHFPQVTRVVDHAETVVARRVVEEVQVGVQVQWQWQGGSVAVAVWQWQC